MPDGPYVPLPDVTCGTACTEQHTYRLNECGLCCAEIDGGVADRSWTVDCPGCKAPANKPCQRRDGTAAAISCPRRWARHDQETEPCTGRPCTGTGCSHEHAAIELTARVHVDATFNKPAATEATQPRECPPGTHSLFDPCPGDCGQPLTTTDEERQAAAQYHRTITTPPGDPGQDILATVRRLLAEMPPRSRRPREGLTPAQKERRDRYAAAIRDHLKASTLPPLLPGGPPSLGATEYDIADVVLEERDTELTQALAERDQLQRAVDAVRQYSQLTIDASIRVQARDQARDTLNLLDHHLNATGRDITREARDHVRTARP